MGSKTDGTEWFSTLYDSLGEHAKGQQKRATTRADEGQKGSGTGQEQGVADVLWRQKKEGWQEANKGGTRVAIVRM